MNGYDYMYDFEHDLYREEQRRVRDRKEMEERHRENMANATDFSRYCDEVTSTTLIRQLFHQVYDLRREAGKPPWTHVYDYSFSRHDKTVWLARLDFETRGRFGAMAKDIVFVPDGIKVVNSDHTVLIFLNEKDNHYVPAYRDLV